jgi:ABC-type multidrug transport system fused ATPase/permease subunit
MENLTLGRAEVTIVQIEEALEAVGMLDIVARLPEGMHTQLTTGGPQLSTSQAVRLTIARALLAKPRLLAIDDVFARFSAEVMQQVLSALTNPRAPWTLLIVTHDQRVQGFCGRTLHLEDGKLREEDTPC